MVRACNLLIYGHTAFKLDIASCLSQCGEWWPANDWLLQKQHCCLPSTMLILGKFLKIGLLHSIYVFLYSNGFLVLLSVISMLLQM